MVGALATMHKCGMGQEKKISLNFDSEFNSSWESFQLIKRSIFLRENKLRVLKCNLRLVLLTRVSKNFYHPNASTGNRVNAFLLTVRLNFVVSIN